MIRWLSSILVFYIGKNSNKSLNSGIKAFSSKYRKEVGSDLSTTLDLTPGKNWNRMIIHEISG